MFGLGKRRDAAPEPVRPPAEPGDAEVIARVCWLLKEAMDDPERTRFAGVANVPLVDLCFDVRAVLVGSPSGRAVLKGLLPGMDADPVSRRIRVLQQDVAELQAELAAAKTALEQEKGDHAETRRELIAANARRVCGRCGCDPGRRDEDCPDPCLCHPGQAVDVLPPEDFHRSAGQP